MIHVIQKVIEVLKWMILHFRQPRHQAKLINQGYVLLVINQEAQKFVTECTYGKQKIPFGKIWSSDSFNQNQNWFRSDQVLCGRNFDSEFETFVNQSSVCKILTLQNSHLLLENVQFS